MTATDPGRRRPDTPYVWPPTLLRPSARLIYLDLNHWIALAKANTGHRDGAQYTEALATLRRARREGSTIFPLSAAHYMELAAIRDPRQRGDVAEVMEELSGFCSLLSKTIVMRLEIEAALDDLGAPRGSSPAQLPLIGFGVGPTLGFMGGLRLRDAATGDDVTETTRHRWARGLDDFDTRMARTERLFERAVLRGPGDADVAELKRQGWDPLAARRVAERRASQENEQAKRFNAEPSWRRGRIRDVVSARYILIELNEVLSTSLATRGLSIEGAFPSPEDARRFVDSMPSADVSVALLVAGHQNPQTKWTSNDMFDLDALSLAAAYCDAVVTERHFARQLHRADAPRRAGTVVAPNLADLHLML